MKGVDLSESRLAWSCIVSHAPAHIRPKQWPLTLVSCRLGNYTDKLTPAVLCILGFGDKTPGF